MEEKWKPINGWPKYEISDRGHVRRVIKVRPTSNGYGMVQLSKPGTSKTLLVHNLVASHFIGDRPKGLLINHIDGNKLNNNVENLQYVTRSENVRHAIDTGLLLVGGDHHGAKLADCEVVAIRLLKGAWPARVVAKIYEVGAGTINEIWRGVARTKVRLPRWDGSMQEVSLCQ